MVGIGASENFRNEAPPGRLERARPSGSRDAARTGHTRGAQARGGAKGRELRRSDSEEQHGLREDEDDDDEEEEDEERGAPPPRRTPPTRNTKRTAAPPARRAVQEEDDDDEDDDEEEEEDDELDFERRFPVGSEAMAVNLREKRYLPHNKKIGVVKKVDAREGKVYIQMKGGAKLVLKADNVVPVEKGKRGRA